MSTSNMIKPFSWPLFLIVAALAVAGLYWVQSGGRKAETPDVVATAPVDGETLDLSRWKGRVVLLNLWATWCAPCRKEMPDLSKLQAELGGADFEVVALSVDRKGFEASQAFLKEVGVTNLAGYIEPDAKSLAALQALGLPATILIDRKGKEAARLLGPADWASAEAKAVVKALLAEK
jgi:thiol-disulfide isomerase/thioredoxin